MHAQDWWARKHLLPGNICCALIHLDQGFDVGGLRRRVSESPIMNWLARVRAVRPMSIFPAIWRTAPKPKIIFFEREDQHRDLESECALPSWIAERELRAERGPGLIFDVVRHADGTSHLYLSWNHTLLDSQGMDLLLKYLNTELGATGYSSIEDFISPKQGKKWSIANWWKNAPLARASLKWLKESGKEPLFSLAPSKSRSGPCKNHQRRIFFTEQETARIDGRNRQLVGGFRRSHFYLAASVRALRAIALKRGSTDEAFLIPVPHDTRRHGAKGPIFSNHLSVLFYRIEPRFADRICDIVGELGRQMTEQIQERFPEACMAALELFAPLPRGLYLRCLGQPTRGKMGSLNFSDSGEACSGMAEFCGGKILDVTHLVPGWPRPGLTTLFMRAGGRLSILFSWIDDCLSLEEAEEMECVLRKALLEEDLS